MSLAFFSGNEVFWKTRWQSSSADGTATPYRTLTTYKDTHFDAADRSRSRGPAPGATRASPRPATAGCPENSLTGQLFIVNSGSSDITVPAAYKNLRLWRNTAVANLGAGQSRTLAPGGETLGYEWDIDADNGFRPRGPVPALLDDGQRRRVVHRLRQLDAAEHDADAPPDDVPGAAAARSSSAPGRCSGRGASTRPTRGAATGRPPALAPTR